MSKLVSVIDPDVNNARTGVVMGLTAYTIWCSFPLYFKALAHVRPAEVLAHRVVWSALFLLVFVAVTGAGAQLRSLLTHRKSLLILIMTALLVSTNWFTFIYAVVSGKVLESSLGYYINPLVSILLASSPLPCACHNRLKLRVDRNSNDLAD